jgi:thymidylate synthase ThyX
VEPERIAEPQSSYDRYYNKAFESYQALLEGGETKEQARQVLPVYSPTKFVAQWNLRSLFHIFDERLNFHTQMATRLTVEEIKKAVAEVFPTLVGFWDKEQEGEE